MNPPNKVETQPTSVLTYVIAVVAIVLIALATWHQLYQGPDAEKAAALARQREAEEQIKNGTYEYARKWGPPPPAGASVSPAESVSPTEDANKQSEAAIESIAEPAGKDVSSKDPSPEEPKTSRQRRSD